MSKILSLDIYQLPLLKNIKTPKNVPKVKGLDFIHILEGEFKSDGKKLSGLHSLLAHPERFIEVIQGPNKHGIMKIKWWFGKGKTKKSTIFPLDWDEIKIAKKILEAYKNSEHKILTTSNKKIIEHSKKIIGKTSEGIKIEMFINNQGILTTAYPLIT